MPNSRERLTQIRAPIAIGELINKITILEIKTERISDAGKLRNVANEIKILRQLKSTAGLDTPNMEPVPCPRIGASVTNSIGFSKTPTALLLKCLHF
jgi:hypothetical protein